MLNEDFDFTLLGETIIKPSTGEKDDPIQVLTNKGTMLFFGAHWSERKLRSLSLVESRSVGTKG